MIFGKDLEANHLQMVCKLSYKGLTVGGDRITISVDMVTFLFEKFNNQDLFCTFNRFFL